EEICLLTIRRATVRVNSNITDFADEPRDAHHSTRAGVGLWNAHGFETFARDDAFLSIAHVEARILQQVADRAHDSSYAVTCSSNRPGTRHLDISIHNLMSNHKTMCE